MEQIFTHSPKISYLHFTLALGWIMQAIIVGVMTGYIRGMIAWYSSDNEFWYNMKGVTYQAPTNMKGK